MESKDNLLLTYTEMDQKYEEFNEQGLSSPYFYNIKKNRQHLYFIGTKHIYNPEEKQNDVIKKHWQDFLEVTGKHNCIVLNEGGLRPSVGSEEEAIKKFGEVGLTIWLAQQEGIEIHSPEPDPKYEIEKLMEKFSREEIVYYYFARLFDQWHRFKDRPDFYQYFESYIKKYKEVTGWTDSDFSLDHMIKLHDQTYDHKFDWEDCECVYRDSHPGRNQVAGVSSRFRNEHIFNEIKKLWSEGKNIFIVYGSGHFIILEKAIKRKFF